MSENGSYGPQSLIGQPSSARGQESTVGAVSVDTTSTQILSANPQRIAAVLVNDGVDVIYLKLGSSPALVNSGIRLNPAGGSIQIDQNFPYIGEIHGIVATTASVITITELSVTRK